MSLAFHPLAEIFPLREGEEFDALVAEVEANGLHEDILLYQGMILDGRNRYLACLKAGLDPRFVEFKGDRESTSAHEFPAQPGEAAGTAFAAFPEEGTDHD
jgi:ParB-like chromosome segregation protein Spo0J